MKLKTISLVVVFMFAISILPMNVFAADEKDDESCNVICELALAGVLLVVGLVSLAYTASTVYDAYEDHYGIKDFKRLENGGIKDFKRLENGGIKDFKRLENGVFIGITPLRYGSRSVTCASFRCEPYRRERGISSKDDVNIGSILELKVGYQFSSWRISYDYSIWNFEEFTADVKQFSYSVRVNSIHLGIGWGSGTVKYKNNNISRPATAINTDLGYIYDVNEQFQINLGLSNRSLSYRENNPNHFLDGRYEIGTSTCFLELTYRF